MYFTNFEVSEARGHRCQFRRDRFGFYDAFVAVNTNGKLIHVSGVQHVDYDGAGRLKSLSTLAGGLRDLDVEYNVEGQPVSVSSTGNDPVSLEYGVGSQLLSRTEHQAGADITDVYVGGYRARYQDEALDEEYVTLSGPTGPLGTIRWSALSADVDYVLTDNLGSGERTYSSGGTFLDGDERSYDAWGNARSAEWGYSDGPDADACFSESEVGYTGHRATTDAGLIDMGLRHYDPSMRRFTSPDPVIPNPLDPQSWNRYAYARGNPTTFVDPNGAAPYDPWSGSPQCDRNCSGGAGGPVGTIGVGIVLLQRNWGDIGRGLRDIGRRARNLFDRGGNGSTPPPMQMLYVPTATNSINFVNSYPLSMPTSLGGTANAEGHGSPAAGLSFGVAGFESAMNYVGGWYELSGPASPFAASVWAGYLGIGSIDPWSSEFQSGEMHANIASLAVGGLGLGRSLVRFGGNVARQGVREWVRQSVRPAVSGARRAVSSRIRGLFGRAAGGGDDLVDAHRAVNPAELADIQATGRFRPSPFGSEGKYFTPSGQEASAYAREAVTAFGDAPYTIVRTRVPKSLLDAPGAAATVEKGIRARVIPNEALPQLRPEILTFSPVP